MSNNYVEDYIVFDLETTGFSPITDKIIEIGALKYHNDKLIDTFDVLINPKTKIPEKITELTGITNEMVSEKETIETALPKFLKFIENYPLIAHNSSFDLGFIEENMKKLNLKKLENKTIDTLELARKNIPTYNHKLTTLKNYFRLNYASHRSLEDCYVTQYVYIYCKEKNKVR